MPWSQGLFQIDDVGTESGFYFSRDYPGGIRMSWQLEATGSVPAQILEELLVRLLCHVYVERLPASALTDVWSTLSDELEWHTRPPMLPEAPQISPRVLTQVFPPEEERPFTLTEE